MPVTIVIRCTHYQAELRMGGYVAGQVVKCPACGKTLVPELPANLRDKQESGDVMVVFPDPPPSAGNSQKS